MKHLLLLACLALTGEVSAQTQVSFSPSSTPKIFAPGFVSDGFDNRDLALSPEGDELFFTLQSKQYSVLLTARKREDGTWSSPEVAPFSGRFRDLEPAYSADGRTLYFSSARPLTDTGTAAKDYDIWWVQKDAGGWGKPVRLPAVINTDKDEYYPSVARSGNLYFTRDNGASKEDIFVAAWRNGSYAEPEALPVEVNSEGYDFNAFVDPDEEFILFTSYKRKDDRGGGDLYGSARKNGRWLPAKNLGEAVNSSAIDYCPFVSPDKTTFYFTSKRLIAQPPGSVNRKLLHTRLSAAGNGSDDVYVMDFAPIRALLLQ